jgi:hypothetical protein
MRGFTFYGLKFWFQFFRIEIFVVLNPKTLNLRRTKMKFRNLVIFLAAGFLLLPAVNCAAFQTGPLSIGGAIRANYVNGDYTPNGTDAPQRGDNGGNFELDVFRINLNYSSNDVLGKVEYRWYDGYNFFHTAWIGYQWKEDTQIQVGLNRVPFGVGAYGPANSWFFDQHYYVGLADDMDCGVKISKNTGTLRLDLAYYVAAEPNGRGGSDDSARYSYDIVDTGTAYGNYEERHQFNFRGIYSLDMGSGIKEDIGISLQAGMLEADEKFADDTWAYAGSIHSKTTMGSWALMLQLTKYDYETDYNDPALSDDLIQMGAFDFAWPVAASGVIPAAALSYTYKPEVEWIDSLTFYNDYSVIIKDGKDAAGNDLNDSTLNVTGVAIASGGWYIYVDYAYSNGNYFVGNEGDVYGATYAASSVGDFGANGNDDWNGRFNINFGYYF